MNTIRQFPVYFGTVFLFSILLVLRIIYPLPHLAPDPWPWWVYFLLVAGGGPAMYFLALGIWCFWWGPFCEEFETMWEKYPKWVNLGLVPMLLVVIWPA